MKKSDQTLSETAIAHEIANRAVRAIEADHPLFLIVYYEQEAVKFSFIKALQQALKEVGLSSQTFDPAHRPEHSTGKLYGLLEDVDRAKILAIVAGLHRLPGSSTPDPSFLEYLNLHRDRIARDRLRFVLFLHTAEAEGFISGAGDLWDFRHHTYWLEGNPGERESLWQSLQYFPEIRLSEEDRAKAKKHMEDIRPLIDQTTNPEEKAAILLDLSNWLRKKYLPGPGAEAALEGLQLIPAAPSRLRGDLEHALGFSLREDHNFPDSLRHYQNSLAIRRTTGDRSGEGETLNNISQIYGAWGRYGEALKGLEQGLAIRREIGDRLGEGTDLNMISQIYTAWGRYDEAMKVLEESLAIRREIGDRYGEGETINNISQIYSAWGRYDEAMKGLKEGLAILREVGDRQGEGGILNNISQIYHARYLNDEALKVLEESLAILREVGDRRGEGVILNNISRIYHDWGRFEEALKMLEEGLAIHREIGYRYGEGGILHNISRIYSNWGRYDEALKTFEESLAIHREIGYLSGEAATCWDIALEYERKGDINKAIDFARRAVEIREETHHPDLVMNKAYLKTLEEAVSRTKSSS
ncbi:MAG: tetratricopeptide repeat protein [Pseudomonadota bacterium]